MLIEIVPSACNVTHCGHARSVLLTLVEAYDAAQGGNRAVATVCAACPPVMQPTDTAAGVGLALACWQVKEIETFIPKACPSGQSFILDAEILLVDHNGKPLPFGTLGVHKKQAFKDATVCIFIFDILHLNGTDLMVKPISERRKVLESAVTPIPGRVMYSELSVVKDINVLKAMMQRAMDEGVCVCVCVCGCACSCCVLCARQQQPCSPASLRLLTVVRARGPGHEGCWRPV